MEELGHGFVRFGVRMFYFSFGSIIGGLVGWHDIIVPSVIFFIGLMSILIGCKLYAN